MNVDTQVSGGAKSMNGNSAVRTAEKAATAVTENLSEKRAAMMEVLGDQFSHLMERGREIEKVSADTFRKHPVASILGVASVAFVAGLLLRRKS